MQQAQRHYTIDEYFAVEAMSPVRNEYFDGEILAMAGGSANHNRISRNVLLALEPKLRGGQWESMGSGARIRTASGLFTYADAVVVHGPLETITNPTVLVEVLSPSARAERGVYACAGTLALLCRHEQADDDPRRA
jgi:Uma2 family endonuclease